MKLDFAKNTKRNMVAHAIGSVLSLFFPFLNRTLFLWLLGPEYLGLNGLFGSILGVLMLAELGFGTAVLCSLYKPVADDDTALLCAYLRFYRAIYRGVGIAIFLIGLCLLPFLRHLVHGNLPPGINLYLLYFLHLLNTSASYFLFAYRGVILGAYHRNDVVSNIRTVVYIAQYIAIAFILYFTRNYYLYVITTITFTIAQNLLLVVASRRLFPQIEPHGTLPDTLRRKVLSDVKSIFLHKVGGVVSYSVDNIVISAFIGLAAVAAYGNYYYVVGAISTFVGIVYSSMLGGFGNRIHTESLENNFRLFLRANRLCLLVILWCDAMMMALYQPFITLWVKDTPHLIRHLLTPMLMVLYFHVNQARQTLLAFKSAAGLWEQDRWKPIIGGIANLTLNILLVLRLPAAYKLDGVILSTIVSYVLIQIPWESHVLFRYFFHQHHAREYWRQQWFFLLAALIFCAVVWRITQFLPSQNFVQLCCQGVVAAAVSTGLLLLFFYQEVWEILGKLRHREG